MKKKLTVENEPVDPPFNMYKNDRFRLQFTNREITLTGLHGKLIAIRKIKDDDDRVIGIFPVFDKED